MELQETFNLYLSTDRKSLRDSLYEEIASKYDKKGPSEEKVTTQNLRDMFDPNTAEKIEDEVSQTMRDNRASFKKDDTLLFNYLKKNHSSRSEDNSKSFLLSPQGIILQPHLTSQKEDSDRKTQLDVELAIEDIMEDLHPKNIGTTVFNKMLKYAIRQFVEGSRGAEVSSDFSGDDVAIDSVIGRFFDATSGKRLAGNKIKEAREGRISADELTYSPASKKDAQQHLEIIEQQDDETRNALSGFADSIQAYLDDDEPERKITPVNLSGEYLIGELNLQSLGSRTEIYKYWQGIYGDYERVKEAFNDFMEVANPEAFDELGDADTEAELTELMKTLEELSSDINGNDEDNLNYVYKVDAVEIRERDEQHKVNRLFMSLLEDMGLAEGKGADRIVEQEYAQMREEGMLDPKETASTLTDQETMEATPMEVRPEMESERETGGRTESERGEMGVQRPMIEVLTDLRELLEEQKEFYDKTPQKVDPLFAYAFNKESAAFKNTAIMSQELDKLKVGIETNLFYLDIEYDDDITEWMEKLNDYVTDVPDLAAYYLPMTDGLKSTVIIEADTWKKKQEKIGKFLETIVGFIERGKGLERSSAAGGFEGKSGVDPFKYDVIFAPSGNEKSLLDTEFISTFREEFDNLLEAVIDFYVIPPSGIYSPFDEEIDLIGNDSTRKVFGHLVKGKQDDGFFAILDKERGTVKDFVDEEDIKKISTILDDISSPAYAKNEKEFARQLKSLLNTVVRGVYGKSAKSVIGLRLKEELGAYYYHMLKKNGNQEAGSAQIFGEDAQTWKDAHKENSRSAASPFVSLLNHIRRNSRGPDSIYMRGASGEQKKALQRFNEMREAFNIVKSETEVDILNAHDSIRKMIGKPIYYNTSKLDNFNHMSIAIDTMQKNYNVDVNAVEIENIVNEFGSLEQVGEKYGVPSESVYFLKANFR